MTTTLAPNRPRATTATAPVRGLRCLVIDDRPADLEELVRILHAQPTVGQVATAPTARAALQALRTNQFDVAFIQDSQHRRWVIRAPRTQAAGAQIDSLASVASFFVSRMDTKVDERLPAASPLRGRVAIANARRSIG